MKLVFCPSCHTVGVKARVERNRCEACGKEARLVRVAYPWQYWLGVGLVFGGAMFLLVPQFVAGLPWEPLVGTLSLRLVWLVPFIGVGLYLTNWAVRVMKDRALERGLELYPEEAKA